MVFGVKEIVRAAAQSLGIADGVEQYLAGVQTEIGQRDTELLVECFNRVENELALDYLPLIKEEELVCPSGVVYYADLFHAAVRILYVRNEKGEDLKYKLFPDRLETQEGELKIGYTYSPTKKSIDGASDYTSGVSERLFIYGVAAEYALSVGELEAASVWDKKYKDILAGFYKISKGKRMDSRRWV